MCYIWVLLGRPNCVATCACSEFVLWNTSILDIRQTLGEQLQGSWSWELWTIHVIILTQNLSLGLSHCMSEYPYWLHAVFPADSWMEHAVIFSWQEETGIAGESTSQRTCVTADRTEAVCGCADCVLTLQAQTEKSTAVGWDGRGQLVFLSPLPSAQGRQELELYCPGMWCCSCRVRFASLSSWRMWEQF